jgi:ribosomal-protein-alanine N-acetyltransferase
MLKTERLVLRGWRASDRSPFAAMGADPRVMRFLGPTLSRSASDALVDRIEAHFAAYGFGLWAVEAPGIAELIGFVGLSTARFASPFTPCVEIAWRLAGEHWGRGYATEAARAALRFGFEQLALAEILAFTTRENRASRGVMQRLGMTRDPRDDFEHPALAPGDPLRPHVLYRLAMPTWRAHRSELEPTSLRPGSDLSPRMPDRCV